MIRVAQSGTECQPRILQNASDVAVSAFSWCDFCSVQIGCSHNKRKVKAIRTRRKTRGWGKKRSGYDHDIP